MIETLGRLVGPEHKDLILTNHDFEFDLLPIIIDQGWEAEAVPIMTAKSMRRYPPDSWKAFLFAQRPINEKLPFKIARQDYHNNEVQAALARVPDFPHERLVDLQWGDKKTQSWWDVPMQDLLELGRPHALTSLRYVVKARGLYRDEPVKFVTLLSRISDCPTDLEQAEAWLEANAETATFDKETKRYVSNQTQEAE
jgi:hypothetical protein